MEFNFEKTQRTVWDVQDRIGFFDQMRTLLNIDDDTAEEIKEELSERNFDYLEVAAYMPGSKQDDPDAVLVFDGKKDVYWDIFNTKKAKQIIEAVSSLAGPGCNMTHKRGLTQRDWRKRLEALGGF